MNPNWYEVWNRRYAPNSSLDLGQLIRLDGFDTGAGRIDVESWQSYADRMASKLGLQQGQSIFEIGCGAGAFLFALRNRHELEVGGIDFAAGLIAAASAAMPDGIFGLCEASECPLEPQYDYVIANAVFHYFSIQQAEVVFGIMLRKARIGVAVLEIPDLRTRAASEAVRRDEMPEGEYSKKYEGLTHTYFDRDWFSDKSKATGFTCATFDGCVPNYIQNQFRFGVVLLKN